MASITDRGARNPLARPGGCGDRRPATAQEETALIIFFGDSITRDWPLGAVAAEGTRNAGVGGDTTGQMRRRFGSEVLALRPRLLHLLGGINDIAGNGGPVTPGEITGNIGAMVDAALAQDIVVVLGLLLPCAAFLKHPDIDPRPAIRDVNAALRTMAAERALPLADYFSPLVDDEAGLRADCTADGLHPNAAGYAVMGPVARAALGTTGIGGIAADMGSG